MAKLIPNQREVRREKERERERETETERDRDRERERERETETGRGWMCVIESLTNIANLKFEWCCGGNDTSSSRQPI
jgi:hypothetical protein